MGPRSGTTGRPAWPAGAGLGRIVPMSPPAPAWRSLAGMMAGAGATHLLAPRIYTPLVPRRLGDPRPWVLWSGLAELACAAGLVLPRTRRSAGYATAALLCAVYPGNVQMAVTWVRSPRASTAAKAVALARLPVQVPLVAWALRVARSAPARPVPGRAR